MNRSRLAVATAACMLLATVPASASTGYAPPQTVQSCPDALAVVTAVADGSLWGVTSCEQQMSLIHRTAAGTWSRRPLPFQGLPRAVADDGRTTFYLFTPPYAASANRLLIAKVPHGGAPSAARLLASGADELAEASLIARDGRWWAVWDVVTHRPFTSHLYQARTIEPALAVSRVDLGSPFDGWPKLVSRGSGALLAVQRGLGDDGQQGTEPVFATAGADGRFTPRNLGIPGIERANVWDMVVSGGGTLIALGEGNRLQVAADDGHLRFSLRDVVLRAPVRAVRIAASGGRVFVAHSEAFMSSAGLWTGRVYVAEGGVTGPLRTSEVSAPFGRSDPSVDARLQDLAAARGRATVVTRAGPGLWSQTQVR